MIGETVAHYKILEKIGEGGMGEVYKAEDLKLKRVVALKFLSGRAIRSTEEKARFEHEAQSAAALNHPNICTIHEIGEHEGLPYIAMEFVEGASLRERTKSGALPLDAAVEVALQVAAGLKAAHDKGIVHRDIKPANIMITRDGRAKIMDFGLAKGPASAKLTQTGTTVGTVAYMSPEQGRGETVDLRADIWSLGAVFYELITGRQPFRGEHEQAMLYSIINEDPTPIADLRPDVPAGVQGVVSKCLEKDPWQRYPDAGAFVDALRLAADVESAPAQSAARPASGAGRTGLGRFGWTIALAVIVLAVVAVLTIRFGFRSGDEPSVTPIPADGGIGVIGFQNLADPSDKDNLGRMLTGLVTTYLAESGGLSVVSVPRVMAALQQVQPSSGGVAFDPAVAPEAARVAGANLMVVGQVGGAEDRLYLTAELIDVQSGRTLASHHEEAGSTTELFSMAGAIASRLGGAARGGAKLDAGIDLARLLTSSPEAYRHYIAGELAGHRGDWVEAVQHMDQAIEADSSFALAYYRAAVADWWKTDYGGGETYLRRGLPYVGRLPDRWKTVYMAFIDYLDGEYDKVHDALYALAASDTDLPDVYYMLGELQTHYAKYVDAAAALRNFEKALEIDPTFRIAHFHLFEDCVETKDFEKGERWLARISSTDPDDPVLLDALSVLRLGQGRYEEAIQAAERLLEVQPESIHRTIRVLTRAGRPDSAVAIANDYIEGRTKVVVAYGMRGSAQVMRGQFREGIADFDRAEKGLVEVSGLGMALLSAVYRLHKAKTQAIAGELDAALTSARRAVTTEPLVGSGYEVLGWIQLQAGDVTGAQATLTELEAVVPQIQAPHAGYWTHVLRSEILLAQGRPREAAAALDPVSTLRPEYRLETWEYFLRGRIHDALGDPASAAAAYREAIQPANIASSGDVITQTLVLYLLAVAEEASGQSTEARAHYQAFLERWGDADVDLPQVRDARERLAGI